MKNLRTGNYFEFSDFRMAFIFAPNEKQFGQACKLNMTILGFAKISIDNHI